MLFLGTRQKINMDKQILREEGECARYGRTASEAIKELHEIHDFVFSIGGSGDIMDAYEVIGGDIGLVSFLDDVAKARMPADEKLFLPNTDYHRRERVEKMLLLDKNLPREIFSY
jgi:hypothetical protein